MDEFTITAIVVIGAVAGCFGIAAIARWQHRALWIATPILLWPTSSIYVQSTIVVLLILGTLIGSRKHLRGATKPFAIFSAFVVWMLFIFVLHGAPVVVDADAARNHFIAMLLSIVMVPVVALQRPPLLGTLKALALSGAAVSLFVFLTYGETAGRVSSETHNPNAIGLAAALALLASTAVAMLSRSPLWLMLTVPSLLVFVGSQNRSGLIVIVVGSVLLWLLQRTGPIRIVGAATLVIVAPFAVDFALSSQRLLFSERETQNFEVSAREAVLGLAIRLTAEHPFFGVGYRHFSDYSGFQLGLFLNTHNDYARIAAEGGVIAILLLGGLVIRVLTFRDPSREGHVLRALTIAACLTLAFGNLITDFRVTWALWVLLGMCWVESRNPSKHLRGAKRKAPAERISEPAVGVTTQGSRLGRPEPRKLTEPQTPDRIDASRSRTTIGRL